MVNNEEILSEMKEIEARMGKVLIDTIKTVNRDRSLVLQEVMGKIGDLILDQILIIKNCQNAMQSQIGELSKKLDFITAAAPVLREEVKTLVSTPSTNHEVFTEPKPRALMDGSEVIGLATPTFKNGKAPVYVTFTFTPVSFTDAAVETEFKDKEGKTIFLPLSFMKGTLKKLQMPQTAEFPNFMVKKCGG